METHGSRPIHSFSEKAREGVEARANSAELRFCSPDAAPRATVSSGLPLPQFESHRRLGMLKTRLQPRGE